MNSSRRSKRKVSAKLGTEWTKSQRERRGAIAEAEKAVLMSQPPSGAVRKIDSSENYFVVWPDSNLTIVGSDAWRLYDALSHVRFTISDRTSVTKDMRDLLRYPKPCDNARARIEKALAVEAAFMGADFDWPHFIVGVIPIKLSEDFKS